MFWFAIYGRVCVECSDKTLRHNISISAKNFWPQVLTFEAAPQAVSDSYHALTWCGMAPVRTSIGLVYSWSPQMKSRGVANSSSEMRAPVSLFANSMWGLSWGWSGFMPHWKIRRCQLYAWRPYTGHNHIGHNHIGHNHIDHNHIGHNHIGHNYTGHKYRRAITIYAP